ncbi:MAG: WYL domain-containing protein [Treponema sp.]|nr:WYL domain-containing protein [Treponema sp.]
MSRRLTDEERRERQKKRDAKAIEKELNPQVDMHGVKILRILREEAPKNPDIKYNSEYFAKRLDVSNVTIMRSIKKLKSNNVLKQKQVHGSYVIDENFDEEKFSEHCSDEIKKNIALIASLGGVLKQYKNTPLYESVVDLVYFLQPEIVKSDKIFTSGRVVVSPQMEYDINTQNWEKVYDALQKNHKLRFRYTKPYTNNEAQRIVWPFQLILDNGSVYLFAYSEYADAVLLYDLNYMADVVVLNKEFKLPKDYDINNYSGGGRLGAYKGDKIEKYKIRFTGYAKEWMKNHKLADDQTFKEDEESTTVLFTSSQFDKVLELILSWGRQAEPLAPARLVKRWKEEVLAMAEKVKD